MSRNLTARLEAASRAEPTRPPGGTSRPSPRPRRREDDPDRPWKLLLAGLCGLIVLIVGYQLMKALTPAEKRLGAQLFDVKEPESGPLTFSIYDTPPLKEVGNCVAVRAGGELFVVRAGSSTINVFRTTTKNGDSVRWNAEGHTFDVVGKANSRFTPFGAPVTPETKDELLPMVVTVINDKVMITR